MSAMALLAITLVLLAFSLPGQTGAEPGAG
jgi:hypothetical protein